MRPMRTVLSLGAALVLVAGLAGQAHAGRDGFYVGLALGGATVSGDVGVRMDRPSICPNTPQPFLWREPDKGICRVAGSTAELEHVSRTDFGSGLGFQLHLGYNIMGHVSLEAAIAGHGNTAFDEGAGHVSFQVRWGFLNLWKDLYDRPWDTDVYVGVGYSIGGYTPKEPPHTDEEKGWEGLNVTFGAAFRYYVAEAFSIGIDLKAIKTFYFSWIANWDEDYRSEPADGAGSFIFEPLVTFTGHFR